MSEKTSWWRSWEIAIDSNWIVTVGMALLFLSSAFLLAWNIRNLLFDKVDEPVSLILLLAAAFYFLFAFSFPGKPLKIALIFLGAQLTVRFAIDRLHGSPSMQHSVGVIGSIAKQIAFAIILFAIAQWFRSVVRWAPPNRRGGAES